MILGTGMALSLTTGTTSANLVTGAKQFLGSGVLTIYARGSATGMVLKCLVSGQAIMDSQPVPYFGATGTLSKKDHEVFSQKINGGVAEVYLNNPTGGTLTTDYIIEFIPMK
jgi:hypothetical protein